MSTLNGNPVPPPIRDAARNARKPVCIMVGSAVEAKRFLPLGASAFIVASDQAFMRQAASGVLEGFAGMKTSPGAATISGRRSGSPCGWR